MRRETTVGRVRWLIAVLAAGAVVVLPAVSAAAKSGGHRAPGSADSGHAHVVTDASLSRHATEQARRSHFQHKQRVGELRAWPAYATDQFGLTELYLKDFRLRAVGPHVEVWTAAGHDDVSEGLDYPYGDCRNGIRTTVTDAQISYLVDQYERVIRPRETAIFGPEKRRDGTNALLPQQVTSVPAGNYRDREARLVVLVDNFRSWGFSSPTTGDRSQGVVVSQQIRLTDRNVLNINGTEWAWQLGADPRDDVRSGDPCTDQIRQPHLIEAILAHERVHVLQSGVGEDFEQWRSDPRWMLEGPADWVISRLGYIDSRSHDSPTNGKIRCFLGELWLLPADDPFHCPAGPSHSLTRFGGLGSYGATWTFTNMLSARFGDRIVGDLVRTEGVYSHTKLKALLAKRGATFEEIIADWSATLALDRSLDAGARLLGGEADRYQVPTLNAEVQWDSPWAAHRAPLEGVAPNGSDFVRLRGASGDALPTEGLSSLRFDTDPELLCPRWKIDPDGHGPGDPAYSAGADDDTSKVFGRSLTVPVGGALLEFDARYDIEPGWDFGFVQISDDGGATWTSLAASTTTSDHDPGAMPEIVGQLPGFTGDSHGWTHQQAAIPERYWGKTVLIGFRYRTDTLVTGAGFWVDNITVGDQVLGDGSSLADWNLFPRLLKQAVLQLVSHTSDNRTASVASVPLDANGAAQVDGAALRGMLAPGATTVGAIVTQIDPDDGPLVCGPPGSSCQMPYTLTANGVNQRRAG